MDTQVNRYRNRDLRAPLIRPIPVAPGCGRKPKIVGLDLNLVVDVACPSPLDLCQPEEPWTMTGLAGALTETAEETGEEHFATVSCPAVCRITQRYDLRPWGIQYYGGKRDPCFRTRRVDRLLLYRIVGILWEATPGEKETRFAARNARFVLAGEKPGIQAMGCAAPASEEP